jgi:hypothetical protein
MYGTGKLKDFETILKYTKSFKLQDKTAIDKGNWTSCKQTINNAASGTIKKGGKG